MSMDPGQGSIPRMNRLRSLRRAVRECEGRIKRGDGVSSALVRFHRVREDRFSASAEHFFRQCRSGSYAFVTLAKHFACLKSLEDLADGGAAFLGKIPVKSFCFGHNRFAGVFFQAQKDLSADQSPASGFHTAHSGAESGAQLFQKILGESGFFGKGTQDRLTAVAAVVFQFDGSFLCVHNGLLVRISCGQQTLP